MSTAPELQQMQNQRNKNAQVMKEPGAAGLAPAYYCFCTSLSTVFYTRPTHLVGKKCDFYVRLKSAKANVTWGKHTYHPVAGAGCYEFLCQCL